MGKRVVLTFYTVSHPVDGRFTMVDDSDGNSAQTFIVKPGEELKFANPTQYAQVSVVVDQILEEGEEYEVKPIEPPKEQE